MNTLKCKALLIKTGLVVFIRALGIYLVLTLPTLVLPPMYMVSAGFALGFGWLAGLLFIIFLYLLQKLAPSSKNSIILLYASIAVSVLFSFEAIEIMDAWKDIWASGSFLLFPFAAVIAGFISASISGKRLNALLQPVSTSEYQNNDKLSPLNPHNNQINRYEK